MNTFENPIFLQQGSNLDTTADALINFINQANTSLYIAIYDFQLEGKTAQRVVDAINNRAADGVSVQIAYDHTTANAVKVNKGMDGDDPALRGTQKFVETNFPKLKTQAIAGSHLMHNKYIIRDGSSVLMGSANFTTGAWSLQENNMLIINSAALATRYKEDFDDLFNSGNILRTGENDYGSVHENNDEIEFAFSPGEGSSAASLFIDAINTSAQDIYIATMVLTSTTILGALNDHLDNNGRISGIYDATQMSHIEKEWEKTNSNNLPLWLNVKSHLVGKHSTQFSPISQHDFMHNKILLTDKTLVTGSFNLSKNAEKNAENVLSIKNIDLINKYKEYIRSIVLKYS